MDRLSLLERTSSAVDVLRTLSPLLQETEQSTDFDMTDVLRTQAVTLDMLISLIAYIVDRDQQQEDRQ